MSFLLDPPLLVATGAAIEKAPVSEKAKTAASVGTVAVFYLVSGALYLEQPWIMWFIKPLPARSGRDWMLNSGVFRFKYEGNGWLTHVLAILIFATYPLFLMVGRRLAKPKKVQLFSDAAAD